MVRLRSAVFVLLLFVLAACTSDGVDPRLASFIEDAQLVSQHELPAVASAGEKLVTLLQGGEVSFQNCPNVRVIATSGMIQSNQSIVVAIIPDGVGRDEAGKLVIQVNIVFDPSFWDQIPDSSKWSYLWHEVEHIKQACQLLHNVAEDASLEGEALWLEFDYQWQQAEALNESYPLAVQAYWQLHGRPTEVFPALGQLIERMPDAWVDDLPVGQDGVPQGIQNQPEWNDWVDLVADVYAIGN